jgi:hypothetical protein
MTSVTQRNQPVVMDLDLPSFAVNYYNLELGEWEPLIEPAPLQISTQSTPVNSQTTIKMVDPVCINSTEECLRNLIHTYNSWMSTPKFYGADSAKEKHRTRRYSQVRTSRNSLLNGTSDNSDSDEDGPGSKKRNQRQFMA